MGEEFVVSDSESLHRWSGALRRALLPAAAPRPKFDLPLFSDDINGRLTREAAKLQGACGCSVASLAMALMLTALALNLGSEAGGLASIPLWRWAVSLLLLALAAGAGKLAGLLWAQRRLIRFADGLRAAAAAGTG